MTTRFVTIDQRQIAAAIAPFENARNLNKAMQAAVSDTMTTGRALIARRIGETINLKIKDIKDQIKITRGSYRDPTGTISTKRKPVPLLKYMGNTPIVKRARLLSHGLRGKRKNLQPGRGIRFRVRKNGPYEYAPFAFIEKSTKNSFVGVFQRIRNKGGASAGSLFSRQAALDALASGKRKTKKIRKSLTGMLVKRYPIRLRMGPTAVGVLAEAPGKGAQTMVDEVVKNLSVVLRKNVLSQIDRVLLNEKSFTPKPEGALVGA